MERIVLEVDDEAGKAFQKFSEESKRRFSNLINIILKKVMNDATSGNYKVMLDAIGSEATAKGLTPEILDGLLKSDD